jgi:hypothetical protein
MDKEKARGLPLKQKGEADKKQTRKALALQ